MLQIRVIMNSTIEEVLDFKCCNLREQNLEIHVTNTGPEALQVKSGCDLESEAESLRLDYLYPPGLQTIPPGETLAFYCTLEETVLARFQRIVFYDSQGRRHASEIRPAP